MKFTTVLVAGVALAAGVDAQRPQLPAWITNMINTIQASRPAFGPPQGGPPAQPASSSSSSSSSSKAAANQGIPTGSTRTEIATAYGSFRPIFPVIPTAPAFSSSSAASSSPSTTRIVTTTTFRPVTNGTVTNSTTTAITTTTSSALSTPSSNSTLISCVDDAKKNPGQAHGAQHRCNWLPGFDINTDTEASTPSTGKVVKYTLTITNGTISPQGDQKIGFLINGQYPGPKIEANWGDNLEITVVNNLQYNGTSMHWHGLLQKGANDADGVGGVTQCPIAPGKSFTYKFQATQYGTAWYHSHFTGQYGDGVYGPIIINGPTAMNYDIDLGEVMISDYYPLTAFQEYYLATRFGPPAAANYLLNGKNAKVDGSGGQRASWTFEAGKKHKLHLINTAVDHHFKFQIDGHSLIVVAVDLNPIEPYRTSELSLSVGQRYDVIVEANATPGNYWLRALKSGDCAAGANDGKGTANGIVRYSGAPNALPTSQLSIAHNDACTDEPAAYLKPIVAKSVDSGAFTSASTELGIQGQTLTSAGETLFSWTLGGISQVIDWSNPTLSNAVQSNNNYDVKKHVVTLNNANAWTYWIFQNQFFVPHPMHVHGHDFRLLGSGSGSFNAGSMMSQLNFANPPRRDTVQVTAQGWVVVAFKTDNPGAWLMHCHMAWHVSGGLSLQYLERPNEIPNMYASDVAASQYQDTCSAWKSYYPGSVWKQEDSGLRKRELIGGIDMEVEVMDVLPERRAVEVSDRHAAHLRRHVSHWGTQAA